MMVLSLLGKKNQIMRVQNRCVSIKDNHASKAKIVVM
jgi:hypothetical protein